jgi:hypothetical protein
MRGKVLANHSVDIATGGELQGSELRPNLYAHLFRVAEWASYDSSPHRALADPAELLLRFTRG